MNRLTSQSLKLDTNCIASLTPHALQDFVEAREVEGSDWKTQNPECPLAYDCENIQGIPVAECEDLLQLYNDDNGKHRTRITDRFKNDKPCDPLNTWNGLSCIYGDYNKYHVLTLMLGNNNLE